MTWFFYLSRDFLKVFFFLFTNVKAMGLENIPRVGPLVVVGNHITFAEPPLIGILLGRKMRYATKEEFFRNRLVGKIMRSLGCFPVYQGRADRNTIRLMEQYVEDDFALVIFPEGTRSLKAELLPALNGAALIAQRTGALILPVGINGTERLRDKFWFLKRPVIHVKFGQPFHLESKNGKLSRENSTRTIMGRIAELLPAEYRGFYSEKETDECKD